MKKYEYEMKSSSKTIDENIENQLSKVTIKKKKEDLIIKKQFLVDDIQNIVEDCVKIYNQDDDAMKSGLIGVAAKYDVGLDFVKDIYRKIKTYKA